MAATTAREVTRRTQAERTAASDARMLEAAIALIVENGTEGTTLKDVGERAGYSRGLASYRFGNKAGLFSAIVHSVGEDWLRELSSAVRDQVGLDAIHAATDAHYRFVSESADRIRAFYVLWFDSIGPDPELRQVIANVHARRQRDVEAWITSGIESGDIDTNVPVTSIAEQFCAAIIGIVYQWLAIPDQAEQIKQLHDGLKQQMTNALMAESKSA